MDDVNKVIGRLLRHERKTRGLSQEALGKLLNITFQQLQKYEKGSNRISLSYFIRIAAYLGIDIERFCRLIQIESELKQAPAQDLRFVKEFIDLPVKKRARIISLMKE